jgi:hypothetical protein
MQSLLSTNGSYAAAGLANDRTTISVPFSLCNGLQPLQERTLASEHCISLARTSRLASLHSKYDWPLQKRPVPNRRYASPARLGVTRCIRHFARVSDNFFFSKNTCW